MENKNSEQIKLEVQEWQITNALVGILGVLGPAACLAFILSQSGVFIDFILNIDSSKPKDSNIYHHHAFYPLWVWHSAFADLAPPYHFHRWLTTLLLWPLRSHPPNTSTRSHKHLNTRNPSQVWRDGSLLCTLVNTSVAGACKDPRNHRLQPPKHGMQLAMEYLDIQPIFTPEELNQPHLTPHQVKQFSKYLHEVHQSISKQTNIDNMRFSTDYVARGMGLVIGEQNRKSTFYIYPIPKHNQQPCDLEVSIKGPCGNNGHIIIPSILHHQLKWQPPTEYRRALYMSSKLNSISPTTQGTSFLRQLSINPTKCHDPDLEIDIRVKISSTRAKVTYVPQRSGVYEVNLITRNCHVVGSPYTVPIELPSTSSTYLSNDSDNESDDANEGKYIKRKKKIISRIVDFIDEKMLLQNDGTLVKIYDAAMQNNDAKLLIQNSEKSKTENSEEIKALETDNLQETYDEIISSNTQIDFNSIATEVESKFLYKRQTEEIMNKPDFKETLDKFNQHKFKEETVKTNREESISTSPESIIEINQSTSNKQEENSHIIFNVSKLLNNDIEPIYFTEAHINIDNLEETAKEILNNSTPDILEASSKTLEKSAPFKRAVNDDKISRSSSKSSFVDPTLFSKVHDPALDFPALEYRKTFSKKDPSKNLSNSYFNTAQDKNYLVNNLVKVFDVTYLETDTFLKQTNKVNPPEETIQNKSSINDPDLVQCHMKKSSLVDENYYSIQKENQKYEKLKSIGALSKHYDKHQCYLKDCLQHNFEQYVDENKCNQLSQPKENLKCSNNAKLGIVDKQKQFWTQKTNDYNGNYFNNKATKQTIILKKSLIAKTKENIHNKTSNLQNIKPFQGIVENNIKIFETKLSSSTPTKTIAAPPIEKLKIKKSKSESFLQEPNDNNICHIQKTLSEEEIIKMPTVEERRNKFLQACQLSSLDTTTSEKKFTIGSVQQNEETTTEAENIETKLNQDLTITTNEHPKQLLPPPQKVEKKQSFKRKARFKRAKLFFHHLEGSDPKINIEEQTEYLPRKHKISRSESDSCVSYNPSEISLKSLKISDRFQVDDLFQDILGDDKRFIGIPNKMAVVASLASLDSDSSRAEYNFWNESEPDMDYFTRKPKKPARRSTIIPGFLKEYPHLPTTDTWRFRARSDPKIADLIPGRVLLTKTETDFDAT